MSQVAGAWIKRQDGSRQRLDATAPLRHLVRRERRRIVAHVIEIEGVACWATFGENGKADSIVQAQVDADTALRRARWRLG